MTRVQLLNLHTATCQAARDLMDKKNQDYVGDGDALANFTRVEALGICSAEKGLLVRLTDKLSRLSTFADKGVLQVTTESVEDTVIDTINYALLFLAYVLDQREKGVPSARASEVIRGLPVGTPSPGEKAAMQTHIHNSLVGKESRSL